MKASKPKPRSSRFDPMMSYMSDYEAIRDDEEIASRKDLRGGNATPRARLREDSDVGRYASPVLDADNKPLGDAGQFFSKGGSASSRADGCAKKGKTRGKMV